MTYFCIKDGKIHSFLYAIDGEQANRMAKEQGGIACLVVGKQNLEDVAKHVFIKEEDYNDND